MNEYREVIFQRNLKLESLLAELNSLLSPVQLEVNLQYVKPKFPLVLIVGTPRSGTTLLMQWLANTNEFAYPSNFISRFFRAPYIGAKIQQMLFDPEYRFRDEFAEITNEISYKSELGKTSGFLDPNEFWYFWRRFFPYQDIQFLKQHDFDQVDFRRFLAELASFESVFGKPIAMKGLIINLNISDLAKRVPNIFFIFLKRDPYITAQSLLESRRKFFGDYDTWYSFKPREYEELIKSDPYMQVAGQVFYTNRSIELGLAEVGKEYKYVIEYEDLCKNPKELYDQLQNKLNMIGCNISSEYTGEKRFNFSNQKRLSDDQFERIQAAYYCFDKTTEIKD